MRLILDELHEIYCVQLPCAKFLMSSMSSSPIDSARDNTAPRFCLLLQLLLVLVRRAASCKLCVTTSAIDSIFFIWTACKIVAVVCITTKQPMCVCMHAMSERPYMAYL